MRDEALSLGVDASQHCCATMAVAVARAPKLPTHPVVTWVPKWNEYLIGIAGSGSRAPSGGSLWERVPAQFCPWCGSTLPASRREEWYDRLHALGYDDPGEQEVPGEFAGDAWWRERA